MRSFKLSLATTALLAVSFTTILTRAEPELERAFIFGSRMLDCPVPDRPSVPPPAQSYEVVFHGSPQELEYDDLRGWGYVPYVEDPLLSPWGDRAGYGIFGPFDDSPNNRNRFGDACPEQIYDSFIGAKGFTNTCDQFIVDPPDPTVPCSESEVIPIDPEGVIFRIDVPNGLYRFVAASGSADNNHTHRILAENGGFGGPIDISDDHVVLVNNFDQFQYSDNAEVFARVGFNCGEFIPPVATGPQFVDMDAEGFATEGPAESPVLEVTEGYIRIHQLQGQSNGGDPNGGNMVVLELWRVEPEDLEGGLVEVERSIDPDVFPQGGNVTVELTTSGLAAPVTITEDVPAGFTVADAGGGTVSGDGSQITFEVTADGTVSYMLSSPADLCPAATINGFGETDVGCVGFGGESTMRCEGSLSALGGVLSQLVIGPIDLGLDAGTNCDDNGQLGTTDYITDGVVGESEIVVEEGDEIEPEFGVAAGGLGVKVAVNPDINPDALAGILTVWRADADDAGYINYNLPENIGDPLDQYVVYSVSYLENLTDSCRDVTLEIGSDDGVKAILNGSQIHLNPVCRGVPGYGSGDMVPATLLPGKNVLLIAVVEQGGGTGVRLVIRDVDGTPITDGTVTASLIPPGEVPSSDLDVVRDVSPDGPFAPGDVLTVTLSATGVEGETTITDSFPADFEVVDAGGGTVDAQSITFTTSADGDLTYTLQTPTDRCECAASGLAGSVVSATDCKPVTGDSSLQCQLTGGDCEDGPGDLDAELVAAFTFGPRAILCPSPNDDAINYTNVLQTDPTAVAYDPLLGYGYEITNPGDVSRGGYGQFGPFDDSPNNRGDFVDDFGCNDAFYGQFIGAKNFATPCNAALFDPPDPNAVCPEPEGIIFRVDLEDDGLYRFVGAFGDADNTHAHRILAENGGSGGPVDISDDHVTLVSNHNQANHATGPFANGDDAGDAVFARVGFDGRIPPTGDGIEPDPAFVNMDENGDPTGDCPSSPTLEVTEGYVRIHQLQGNSNDGCGGAGDPNGGDMVVLEVWQVFPDDDEPQFRRGDVDGSGTVDISDPIANLTNQFLGGPIPCRDAADYNDSGAVDISDPIANLTNQFLGGPPAAPPGSETCGSDPTPDAGADGGDLGCENPPTNC